MDNTPEYVNSRGLPDIPPAELGDSLEIMCKSNTSLSPKEGRSGYFTKVQPYLGAVLAWTRDGMTHEDVANKLGITTRVLYLYRNKYPEFAQILKYGREHALAKVENKLYISATGETVKEEKYETIFIDDPNHPENGKVIKCTKVETKIKQVPANFMAQMAILRNRLPEKWNVADKVQISGELSFGNLLKKVRENEAQKRAEQLGLDTTKEVKQVEG
jgi:hypothetical protein